MTLGGMPSFPHVIQCKCAIGDIDIGSGSSKYCALPQLDPFSVHPKTIAKCLTIHYTEITETGCHFGQIQTLMLLVDSYEGFLSAPIHLCQWNFPSTGGKSETQMLFFFYVFNYFVKEKVRINYRGLELDDTFIAQEEVLCVLSTNVT